jgi:uncharacterized protein (TIGR00730 family)
MGNNPAYKDEAEKMGIILADKNIKLVYGGGNVGLMGILADSNLRANGTCIGVMPGRLIDLEIAHDQLSELIVVDSMNERKAKMAELSDGFIAMPGGFGTLDELSEALTYNQLRLYDKPVGLLNINGYFDHLLDFFDFSVEEKFVRAEHRNNLIISDDTEELIRKMMDYIPVNIGKWIDDIREESSLES